MSVGYVKVFSSILDSTVWQEDSDTKVIWITMLAMTDKDGIVYASVPGLARRAGVSVGACEKALGIFQEPDKHSRTPDHEGRRIEPIDGGWLILNHSKYRYKLSAEDRRESDRIRQQRHRERLRHAQIVTERDDSVKAVTDNPRHNNTDTDTDTDTDKNPTRPSKTGAERNTTFDGEGSVRKIQRLHPRYESGQANETAIVDAIEAIAREDGISEQGAAAYLLARTKLYRDCTASWPDKTKITGSTRWFATGQYRQHEAVWTLGENINPASSLGPSGSEKLKARIAAAGAGRGQGVKLA